MTDYKRVALKPETVIELSTAKAKMLADNPSNSSVTDDDAIRHALEQFNDQEKTDHPTQG